MLLPGQYEANVRNLKVHHAARIYIANELIRPWFFMRLNRRTTRDATLAYGMSVGARQNV